MEIRSGLEGLRTLLGVDGTSPPAVRGTPSGSEAPAGADRATLSAAANQMAEPESGDGVRSGKVAAIQAAVAAGTYQVPAAAVASKLVDAMLGGGK
jgi:flagellar biosynthesis anti-sigma factor FlgM